MQRDITRPFNHNLHAGTVNHLVRRWRRVLRLRLLFSYLIGKSHAANLLHKVDFLGTGLSESLTNFFELLIDSLRNKLIIDASTSWLRLDHHWFCLILFALLHIHLVNWLSFALFLWSLFFEFWRLEWFSRFRCLLLRNDWRLVLLNFCLFGGGLKVWLFLEVRRFDWFDVVYFNLGLGICLVGLMVVARLIAFAGDKLQFFFRLLSLIFLHF